MKQQIIEKITKPDNMNFFFLGASSLSNGQDVCTTADIAAQSVINDFPGLTLDEYDQKVQEYILGTFGYHL